MPTAECGSAPESRLPIHCSPGRTLTHLTANDTSFSTVNSEGMLVVLLPLSHRSHSPFPPHLRVWIPAPNDGPPCRSSARFRPTKTNCSCRTLPGAARRAWAARDGKVRRFVAFAARHAELNQILGLPPSSSLMLPTQGRRHSGLQWTTRVPDRERGSRSGGLAR